MCKDHFFFLPITKILSCWKLSSSKQFTCNLCAIVSVGLGCSLLCFELVNYICTRNTTNSTSNTCLQHLPMQCPRHRLPVYHRVNGQAVLAASLASASWRASAASMSPHAGPQPSFVYCNTIGLDPTPIKQWLVFLFSNECQYISP
jgi:hypothetical protein